MARSLYRMGRFSARRPWVVIGTWIAVSVLVIGAAGIFGQELQDTFEVPGLDSQQATDLLTAAGSDSAGLTAQVVVAPTDDRVTFFDSPDARSALMIVQTAVRGLPNVIGTSDPAGALAMGSEAAVKSGGVSPDGRVALIRVQYPVIADLDTSDLDNLKALSIENGEVSPVQIEMNGDLFFSFEEAETSASEMVGLVVAVVVLLVAFGSLIAMGLPIGMALFGLALGISAMSLVAYLIEIPSWAPQLAAMIGLGVGIDYALFLVTRHREFLARGMTVEESAGRAVATSGQAVIFAGGTVVIAILGLAVAGVPAITAAGVAISMVVLIMVVASVTLLPAFLGFSGHGINRFGIHRAGTSDGTTVSTRWKRWGQHVTQHAWAYTIGTTAILLLLATPVLSLRLGFPDEGTLPESRTERRAYDLVAQGFGPGIN
ncbi:MAG: MMPL family transporter, partial [Actinomycetia bacterium]|nr:MMPL family transporter [Actinomycetes bacterium]